MNFTEQKKEYRNQWKKEFAHRLKARMEYLDISQNELAKRTGIPQPVIGAYVHGRCMPLAMNIAKLAKALIMSSSELIDF